jgi:hypothetical protein
MLQQSQITISVFAVQGILMAQEHFFSLGYVKSRKGRQYEVIFDSHSGRVWGKWNERHFEVGTVRSPEEAIMLARAQILTWD